MVVSVDLIYSPLLLDKNAEEENNLYNSRLWNSAYDHQELFDIDHNGRMPYNEFSEIFYYKVVHEGHTPTRIMESGRFK